jgi:hypothetical protein
MLLPLHSFAIQGGWLSSGIMFSIAHEVDHLEGKKHHHHDGADVPHYDDSTESAAHFADHSASQPSAATLPSVEVPSLTIKPITAQRVELSYYIPDPFLEDPQRPPTFLG